MLHVKAWHEGLGAMDRPALVILHGMLGAGDNWLSITRDLARDYRVFTVDLPGHGESASILPDRPFFYPNLARELHLTLVATLADEAVILAGHSMGGKVAMTVALQYPARLAGLIVVDAAPRSYVDSGFNNEVLAMLRTLDPAVATSRTEMDMAMKFWLSDAVMRGFMLKNLVPRDGGGFRWRFAAEAIVDGAQDIADWPEAAICGTAEGGSSLYEGPCLVLKGELSPYVDVAQDMPLFRKLFPAITLEIVDRARHWVHFDNKAHFLSLTRAFLS